MVGQAERLYQINSLLNKSEHSNKSKIIAVTSGKGGTGKSFVASNLSVLLAHQNKKVLLVDLDINLSNQNVFFNISNRETLYHYLIHNCELQDTVFEYSDNLDIILGESGKLDHPSLNDSQVSRLFADLRKLNKKYDLIILDTSSGIERSTLEILLNSDEIFLVASSEPTSVMDGYVILKMLKSRGATNKINVIINKCLDEKDAVEAYDNLQKAANHFLKTNINYLGMVSFSKSVIQSIKDQNPLVLSDKNSTITRQFNEISSKFRIPTIG